MNEWIYYYLILYRSFITSYNYCVCIKYRQRSHAECGALSGEMIDLTNHQHAPAASQWAGSAVSDVAVTTCVVSFFMASRVTRAADAGGSTTETYTVSKIAIRVGRNHISKRFDVSAPGRPFRRPFRPVAIVAVTVNNIAIWDADRGTHRSYCHNTLR